MVKRVSAKPNQAKRSRLSPTEFGKQVARAGVLYDQGKLAEAAAVLKGALKAAPAGFNSKEKAEVWEQYYQPIL